MRVFCFVFVLLRGAAGFLSRRLLLSSGGHEGSYGLRIREVFKLLRACKSKSTRCFAPQHDKCGGSVQRHYSLPTIHFPLSIIHCPYTFGNLYPLLYFAIMYLSLIELSVNFPFDLSQVNFCCVRNAMFPN